MAGISKIDFATFNKTKYFPALDGLRAFCVLWVMFNHVRVPVPHWVIGSLGVDVFFVLSGFLITTLMIREIGRTGSLSLKGFYTRRLFRIVPVYLATVLLYFIAVHAGHDAVKTAQFNAALPWLLTFFQEYRPATGNNILGHAWTLGIEEKFYVFWPLLLLALFPFRKSRWWWLATLFAGICFFPERYARSYDGLLLGALLGIALSVPGRSQVFKFLGQVPDTALCALVVAAYALFGYDHHSVLFFSAAIALLVASLVLRVGPLRRLLESQALVFIGKRSYAMYLIHVLVLNAVEQLSPRLLPENWLLIVLVAYVLTLAAASLMYVTIERPCIALGRRLSGKWTARERHVDTVLLPAAMARPDAASGAAVVGWTLDLDAEPGDLPPVTPYAHGNDGMRFRCNEKHLGAESGTLGSVERIESGVFTITLEGIGNSLATAIEFYEYLDYGDRLTATAA